MSVRSCWQRANYKNNYSRRGGRGAGCAYSQHALRKKCATPSSYTIINARPIAYWSRPGAEKGGGRTPPADSTGQPRFVLVLVRWPRCWAVRTGPDPSHLPARPVLFFSPPLAVGLATGKQPQQQPSRRRPSSYTASARLTGSPAPASTTLSRDVVRFLLSSLLSFLLARSCRTAPVRPMFVVG